MVKKLLKCLLTVVIVGTFVGCGAQTRTVSEEDLQMLREMRDELKAENDSLRSTESSDDENDAVTETEKFAHENSEMNSTDVSDIASEGESYQIRFNYGVGEEDSAPKIMGFDFEVDGKWISTEDLTCEYRDGRLYREVTRDNRPGIKNKKEYVELSPEHLKEVRNIFIEAYNTFFKEYEDKFCEVAQDVDVYVVEVSEGCPEKFPINVDGKRVDFMVEKFSQGHWSDYGSGSEDEHTYTVGLDIDARVDGLSDFTSYIENLVAEDEGKEFSYDDYRIVDNTIKPDTKETESVDNQENGIEAKEEPKSSSIIGTFWDPTGYNDAEFTFNADGTGQHFCPSTGKVGYTFTYTVEGNKITVKGKHSTDSFTLDGDTLISVDGKYKRK